MNITATGFASEKQMNSLIILTMGIAAMIVVISITNKELIQEQTALLRSIDSKTR